MDFLKTIDNLVSIWVIPIGGLLTAVFVGWFMDKDVAKEEFLLGTRLRFFWLPWRFFMRYVVPFKRAGSITLIRSFITLRGTDESY